MKKSFITVATVLLLCSSMIITPSCIGSFSLTNRLLGWNKTVGSKFVNELVFFAFWVLPVYEVSCLADLLVLNSIEFWSGRNPMTASTEQRITGSDGQTYIVRGDAEGYTVENESGKSMRLAYDASIDGWTVEADGERHILFTFVDDNHIALPDAAGNYQAVELSAQGVNSYAGASIAAR